VDLAAARTWPDLLGLTDSGGNLALDLHIAGVAYLADLGEALNLQTWTNWAPVKRTCALDGLGGVFAGLAYLADVGATGLCGLCWACEALGFVEADSAGVGGLFYVYTIYR